MYKLAISVVFTYSIAAILMAQLAGHVSQLTAMVSILMTLMVSIMAAYFGDSK